MAEETEVEMVTRLHAVEVTDLYPALATDDTTSRVCLLCAAKLKDKTHNLTRHLERHHAGALLQLLEQRNQASPRAQRARSRKRGPQDKTRPARLVQDTRSQAQEAKFALARWLAHEQLPVDVIDKSGFQEFIKSLNGHFSLPKRHELTQVLGTLTTGSGDDTIVLKSNDDTSAPSLVEMLAVRATCRCSEDTPLVSFCRVVCDIAGKGEAKIRVVRGAASFADAQTCRGKRVGRNGVLGRLFVGRVSEVRPEITSGHQIKVLDKVVASPYRAREQPEHVPSVAPSASVVGISASCGTLAEYIVLPVSNLAVVPPALPDDVALLADDMSVVLSIGSKLQRRHVTKVAILSDPVATILSNLLTRCLHQDMNFSVPNVLAFSTSATSNSSMWSQYAIHTTLDIYQPASVATVLARQTELAVDAVVDLISSEASTEFATSLVQSMGCVVLVDRSRFEMQSPSTFAMDVNAVVVKELEIISVQDCSDYLAHALQYLTTQIQNKQSAMELRECLMEEVELSQVLSHLQTRPEEAFEARYLQVKR
ncbi:hypothetical protein PsorP6_011761 [Peronosclerospora sorghi]|uniref:Uncharacterized protein n=1 Tax=Peronosclerospora sorghi TaxID=230839 RepID=A0ACC0WHW8_9STRA|nr:hypothetical protein PsorP6_011761 [Peronosclerospora sorghi]